MHTLFALLVLLVIAWGIWKIVSLIPMDGTLKSILWVVLSIIFFLAVLQILGIYDSGMDLDKLK